MEKAIKSSKNGTQMSVIALRDRADLMTTLEGIIDMQE